MKSFTSNHIRSMVLLASCCLLPHIYGSEENAILTQFAFGSCADQDRAQPVWAQVIREKPDLWIWTGDNIYADTEDMLAMWEMYQKLLRQPGYAELLSTGIPVLATWDDHDYGLNDGGREYPMREASKKLFLEFFDVPESSPRWQRDGVYHSERFGPDDKSVQIILLDTRFNRSPLKKETTPEGELITYLPSEARGATMLGEAQWQWLEQELKKPARLRFIVSSIQFIASGHRFEKWANLPSERKRLLDLLDRTRAEGVIIISGDRHHAELSVLDRPGAYPLIDLTASGINKKQPQDQAGNYPVDENPYRIGEEFHEYHFGMARINWAQPDPLVTLEIIDKCGERPIRYSVRLGDLAYPE